MKIGWYCAQLTRLPEGVAALIVFAAIAAAVPLAAADAPEWLRAAARLSLPSYAEETDAVILHDEMEARVKEGGEIVATRRLAYKILRPEGREHGTFEVSFDSETRVTFLKAWSISKGREGEVKEKDAVETGITADTLYSDLRRKIITAPQCDPGSVVGYEYEQKRRPALLQDIWWFQDPHPVRYGRYTLQLPQGWEYRTTWIQYPQIEPQKSEENRWVWEVENVPAIISEPAMPPWQALGGRLALTYLPPGGGMRHESWGDVGKWHADLAAGDGGIPMAIGQKVRELAPADHSWIERLRALASFAQRDVRYVSIQIGIGGYRPHAALQVFQNRYGDCKDKATLLRAMLKEIGTESYLVLVNSERGAVVAAFPSILNFDHVILAIRVPTEPDGAGLFAVSRHARLGTLLFFDPTDGLTPPGYLPQQLQGGKGLLVTPQGGELVDLPVLFPTANRMHRNAQLMLSPEGALGGTIQETYRGAPAANLRSRLLSSDALQRVQMLEDKLSGSVGWVTLEDAGVVNLEAFQESLVLQFRFRAEFYAQKAGDLLLVRPRVIGWKGYELGGELKERKQPFVFDMTTYQSDTFEIALPEGFQVDELPRPVEAVYDFGEYRSSAEDAGRVLRYSRTFMVKCLEVPAARIAELRKFFAAIDSDQRAYAVLKRAMR